jgi:predicted MFS family arabinose efflux permease
MLVLFGGCSIFGSFIFGFFADRLQVSTCILVSSVGSVLSIFLFWGLSDQVALLAVFAITYGFFAGAYSSTWPGVLKEMRRMDQNVETGLMYGILSGGRGLGYALSGPLSSVLLNTSWPEGRSWGYGTEYGPMILFTGISALLGGWGFCQRWLRSRN